jgi:uncharacterized protein YciI
MTESAPESDIASPPVRYIILHVPGRGWKHGVPPTEQVGVAEHGAYLAGLFRAGKIEISGPFLKENAGGMVLTAAGVTPEEADRMGRDDPAFTSGLIDYEVRPWLTVFRSA